MKINFAEVRSSPEFTSAMIRYGFWFLSSLFIGLAMWSGYYEPLWEFYLAFLFSYLVYTTIVFISILYKPYIPVRPYLTIPVDVAAISVAMMFTEDGPFSPFFLFYPWYFVSYALRYGRGPLFAAAIASLISFAVVLFLTDTWYSHVYDVIAYIVFLVVMPFYLDVMLRRINKARDEANRANRAKSEFLAAMSHEIRTPMSGIVGVSSLLEKTGLNEDQREYVAALQESSVALNALIDDVLDLSKIEAGKYVLEDERFNLPKTLYGVAQMFEPCANAKGIELFLDYACDVPDHVMGDGKRLRQIVLNLVSNAIKFTAQGEVCIRVRLAGNADRDDLTRIRIEVRDTGPGLSEEQQQHIFEPFYQAGSQHNQPHSGTGLGTTISANLVRLMHGDIGLVSKPGEGSTFWFEIPWRAEVPAPLDLSAQAQVYPLIVYETHATSRQILQDYCAGLGWPCRICAQQDELIKGIEQELQAGAQPLVLLSELACAGQCVSLAGLLRERFADRLHIGMLVHLSHLHTISTEQREAFDQFLTLPITPHRLRNMLLSMIDPAHADTAQAEQSNSMVSRFLHILVAEDSPINAKVITTFLIQDGHRVDHVENGRLALEALRNNDYDLVLMDMRMPELDGLETTRQWRAQETDEQHIPIVALTANATTEDKNNCLAAGMDEFLSKPVSQEQLRKMLAKFTV